MSWYQVLVSSPQFHGQEPLTYEHASQLAIGSIVVVPLRNRPVVGVILKKVGQPSFKTKPIEKVVTKQPLPETSLQLADWLQQYYPGPLGVVAQLLLPSSLVRKRELANVAHPQIATKQIPQPPLTQQQKEAVKQMTATAAGSFLLHGDTGTGKTRVYLELAQKTLAAGRNVLLLTPEIGLTPQLEHRVRQSLPYPVVVLHSQLSPAERRTAWLQILQAEQPLVVVGPRSALFAPLKNLGLIVVDEAHDQAYKQESMPNYQALRVAGHLAQLHRAKLIMGTATPPISEYSLAEAKQVPIIRLTEQPAGQHTDKHITVVDLKERDQFTGHPHLSNKLLAAIKTALDAKEQVLILLNRRGTARLVICQNCGWQATCPNCDLPLTFHADRHQLRCHTCGYTGEVPSNCPVCRGVDLIFKGFGTKSLASELAKQFPHARLRRFDTDNTKAESLEQNYHAVASGEVDILVGTQMLAKGLDLPRLTVVGVVLADSNLYFPDYTAEEQTYQLLTQVIGRVGRGHSAGTVVIQSYSPASPPIQAAVNQQWHSFYDYQLAERKAFGFPPFYHTLKLSCRRASSGSAAKAAEELTDKLSGAGLRIELVGPTPSFYQKVGGKYQWQLVVKAKSRAELLKVLPLLPANWNYDLDPLNLL